MKKRILLLEDEQTFVKAFKATLGEYAIKSTDNLLIFDNLLYEDPNHRIGSASSFDLIVIDAALSVRAGVELELMDQIPDLFQVGLETSVGITKLAANIHLYGWDYFQRVIRLRNATKDCYIEKFMLMSGQKPLIEKKGLFPESPPSGIEFTDKGRGIYDIIRGRLGE